MPASATISSEPRVYAQEIAEALAAGDTKKLAALAFELAVKVETGEALAARDRERKAKQTERVRRHRAAKADEESVTLRNATSRDSALQDVTPPAPLDIPPSGSPPFNPPSTPENGALAKKPRSALKTKPPPDEPDGFAVAWQAYPRRSGTNSRQDALAAYRARLGEGVLVAEMIGGARRYAAWCEATGKVGTELVMQAARFFGRSHQFENQWALPTAEGHVETEEEAQAEIRRMAMAVEGRRAQRDGEEWWAEMQREANTTNARTLLRHAYRQLQH